MALEEQVLVVERDVVERVGMFQGLSLDVERYLDAFFARDVARFMPRSRAEADPAFKQIIPYVIMTHGRKCLSYIRGVRAGETRLVGRRSIGIGGHINPTDDEAPLFELDFREVYQAAVKREVAEEVAVETAHPDRVVALINDDSNEVGQVHLGIVHLWELEAPTVAKREQMITQMAFLTPSELHAERDNLETWSQLCLNHLDDMPASEREHGKSLAGRGATGGTSA